MRWREEETKGLAQNFTYRYPASVFGKTHLPMQETHEIRVPSLGREDASGVGKGNLLQYSCQENPIDRGACSVVHGITKSWP